MQVLLLLTGSLLLGADDKKDLDKMQGTWDVVAAEQAGQKTPADELKKVMLRLVIKGDKFEYRVGNDVALKGSFKLDETKKPKTIDVKGTDPAGKEDTSVGIYQIEGDTIRVCFVEKGNRPTEFVTKEGSPNMMIVYKRVKP